MRKLYSNERNIQILIALLKAHGIRKLIVSPGATNVTFVGSVQHDSYFEMYSAVDERSAAYIACGLAEESGEPVALSCTGATASRNYLPGLTEAFYRKLPIIAITSSHVSEHIGHLISQVTDRNSGLNDVSVCKVLVPIVKDEEDAWNCEIQINKALLATKQNGGGPVHINIETQYSGDYSVEQLPPVKVIKRYIANDVFPTIPKGRIAIFVGSHSAWSNELTDAVDRFCEVYNGVVFYDHTSGYKGKYGVLSCLLGSQDLCGFEECCTDLVVHIGEMTGAYASVPIISSTKEIWRVNADGELRDPYKLLTKVFQMREITFFDRMNSLSSTKEGEIPEYFQICKSEYQNILDKVLQADIPFSNIWIARRISTLLPSNSVLHLAIMNTLRSWNFFEIPASVRSYCNVGAFGIDGIVSSLIGASLVNKEKLYFGIVGDLAFFYDMNVLGNRHIGNNVRILLINNGHGQEFRNYFNGANKWGNKDAEYFMAAEGHYAKKSPVLVRHYAEDLGFEYLTASSIDEFENVKDQFLTENITEKPMLLEIFTTCEDENNAIFTLRNVKKSMLSVSKKVTKKIVKSIAGEKNVTKLKSIFNK